MHTLFLRIKNQTQRACDEKSKSVVKQITVVYEYAHD